VDEAVAILGKYNINWDGGTALHYLIADNGGDENGAGESALVEFFDGKMVVLPNDTSWHLATNHLRVNAQGDGGCDRYAKIRQQLTNTDGKITIPEAVQLLSDVSQAGDYPTQWSIVYEFNTGEVEVVMGREYSQHHTFQIPMVGK